MALELYDLCVPSLGQVLGCQIGMIQKTIAYAESKRADPTPLLRRSIGKGELPLVEHALTPATIALEVCTHAANVTSPVRFDTAQPATFQRIATYTAEVRNFMNAIPRGKFSSAGEEMVPSPVQAGEQIDISVKEFVLHICLPYTLFSSAATYWILSGSGVPVSKIDYPFPPAW